MAVLIAVEPATLSVEPGGTVTTQVRIRNQGSRVDEFQLTVLGEASAWATVEPPSVNLFPRTEGTATVTFRPPRASLPAAGTMAFGVLARSIAEPDASAAEEGNITVGPFVALAKELMPRTSHGRRAATHTLQVRNDGNAPAQLTARAVDPDGELGLALQPTSAEIAAGGTTALQATARAKSWLLFGSPRRYPFSIDVTEAAAGTESVPAVFEQRSLLPTWLLAAAGLAIALIAIGMASGIFKPTGETATPGPSTIAGGQPTTAAQATAPGGEPTDATIDPTPTPGPTAPVFGTASLAISGDGFDDVYVSDGVGALYVEGKLVINFPVTINGAPCLGRTFVPAASGVATYPLGDRSQGADYYADFECGGGALFQTTVDQSGELRIDQFAPTVSGHVSFGATDGIHTISFGGDFQDVPIATP